MNGQTDTPRDRQGDCMTDRQPARRTDEQTGWRLYVDRDRMMDRQMIGWMERWLGKFKD